MKFNPFTNIQVDLLGDIKVKAMCNSRAPLKTYPMVFVCMNTGSMSLGRIHAYHTIAFLIAIRAPLDPKSRRQPTTWLTPPTTPI